MTWLLDLAGIVLLIAGMACASIYRPRTSMMPAEGRISLRVGLGMVVAGIAVILLG